ncbi:hypothetical protein KIW84_054272 [Lathyrus oleraceus]|uniref:Chromo domain-containing protein n=1 Tax=Pisum sativum TaxID=3888 RepID=A0A9D4WUZ1_PEA|nr:hypothetical protein KIW84_054272 [Pisum sativum]
MGEEQRKWISKLLGFDFEVKRKPGKGNNAVDSLSRQMQYAHIITVQCEAWEGLEEEVQGEGKLKAIVTPPVLVKGDTPFSAVDEVHKLTTERNVMLKDLQEQLLNAQDLMRNKANKHRIEVEHEIGAVTYKLKFPDDTRVHPVFHVSLLKKVVKPNEEPQPLPACMNADLHLEPTPERVVKTRRTEQGVLEVLIKWKNLREFENSWELVKKTRQEFPEFLLEVKESFEGGGIDRYGNVESFEGGGIDRYGNVYRRTRELKLKTKSHTFSRKTVITAGKVQTFNNSGTPARGSAPWTPAGRCPAPRQGLRPLEPQRGAAPHPARGYAPWNPVFNYLQSITRWLYERALRTTPNSFPSFNA